MQTPKTMALAATGRMELGRVFRKGMAGDVGVESSWTGYGLACLKIFRGERRSGLGVSFKVGLLAAVILLALLLPSQGAEGAPGIEAVRDAIRSGDEAALARLLKNPELVNARDEAGDSPLILAAHLGTARALDRILAAGGEVNATNRQGASALLRAAGDPAKVARLLARGAQPNVASMIGHTPLMLAARHPHATESVRLLLARGAEVNARSVAGGTALMAAAAASNLEAARLLVEHGADVNQEPVPTGPGLDPIFGGVRTPLMWAAFRGDRAMAAFLLDHGANVNQVATFGTPLTQAALRGSTDMVRYLVDRGADVRTAEPYSGFTPLHWAAASDQVRERMVKFLLRQGADPAAEGGQPVDAFLGVPQTPLMLARQRGETTVTRLLSGGRSGGSTVPVERSVRDGTAPDSKAIAATIARAIPALQSSAVVSKQSFLNHGSKQNCVSCHQQYFPMAAVGVARTRNLGGDPASAVALRDMVLSGHRGGGVDAEPMFHPDGAHDYGYALLAMRLDGAVDAGVTDPLVHHLAAIQQMDGHWNVNLIRPPLQSSDVTATALGIHALKHFAWPARSEEFAERVARAKSWMVRVKPMTHEERVYQILGLHWAGASSEEVRTLAERLLLEQRNDGGWAQLAALESDAYATGQAIFALREAAMLPASHPAFGKAAAFLVSTQDAEGTWHVKRRAFPFQPTMESGFPHGRDSWISATGTSWAVMGLARLIESVEPGTALPTAAKALAQGSHVGGKPQGSAEPIRVDFATDIRPVLERSCLPCHSGEKPRGGFRLTDRPALVGIGNSGVPSVLPGRAVESPLMRYVTGKSAELAMPPVEKRGTYPELSDDEIARVGAWIDAGAPWPDGVVLGIPTTAALRR